MTEQRLNNKGTKDDKSQKADKQPRQDGYREGGAARRLAEKQQAGSKRKGAKERIQGRGKQQSEGRDQSGFKRQEEGRGQARVKRQEAGRGQSGFKRQEVGRGQVGVKPQEVEREHNSSAASRANGKAQVEIKQQRYTGKPSAKDNKGSSHVQKRYERSSYGDSQAAQRANGRAHGERQAQRKGSSSAEEVAVGDRIVVTIKRIGINGEGVGYYKRKAVFVEGAITDEVIKARVTAVERSYLQAELVEIEKHSPHRQEPPCPVYELCGGCQMQHMTYEAQLRAKEEIVREAFSRYADLKELPLRPIYGMEEPWHYRNKAQLQLGWQQQGEEQQLVAGLYAANSHKLIDISECTVQETEINEVYKRLKHILLDLDIPPYDERTRDGCVKTIVVRIAKASGQMQVTFVTATDKLPQQRLLVQRIRTELPQIITIAHNVHKERSSVIFGPKTVILWGEERLPETLGSIQFALSPRAFFQLNPTQTVKLYDAVKEAAALTGHELVVDAYCGTGTISLWLAEQAKEVRGVELIAEAVTDARSNAQYSGIDNALFYEGRAEQLIPQWVEQGIRPDVIVVDPPRTGLDAALIKAVVQAKPKRFVYVSCNPSTLAKDCKELLGSGYELEWVQPVDMFPQTSHVECCSLLVLKDETKLN